MADVELRQPRRKKGAKSWSKESAFPVPIQGVTEKEACDDRWYYYKGYLRENCVAVEEPGDVTFLYRLGFFGKGSLSKSKPEHEALSDISQRAFSRTEKIRRLPPKERKIRQSKFREIRKERFRNHVRWYNVADPAKKETGDQAYDITLSENESKEPYSQQQGCTVDETCDWDEEQGGAEKDKEDSSSEDSEAANSEGNENMEEDNDDEVGVSQVTEDIHDAIKLKQKKKKVDPYKVFEQLQLTLEEAFFLSFGLGCLAVVKDEKILSLREMWCEFCAAQQGFIPKYVAYHYFRSKGWVPKSGIKYGSDFVLYKEGMPFYHSSYSVIVQLVDSQTLVAPATSTADSLHCRQVTWAGLSGLNRVNEHAAKEVLICHVVKPADITGEELSSPDCISRFRVQEVVMRRWIPEKARDPKTASRKGS